MHGCLSVVKSTSYIHHGSVTLGDIWCCVCSSSVTMLWTVTCLLLWQRSVAHFTQQWAVHISGGRSVADQVALDHGFVNVGEVINRIIS